MKIRCGWHVVLGIVLPWLCPEVNLGGVAIFLGYQYLQYRYRSTRQMKDDSYKDVYEFGIAYVISAVVRSLRWIL